VRRNERNLTAAPYPSFLSLFRNKKGHAITHPGNVDVRAIVEANQEAYNGASSRAYKQALAGAVVRWVEDERGGLFLAWDQNIGLWQRVTDVQKVKKVQAMFRDAKARALTVPVPAHGGMMQEDGDEVEDEADEADEVIVEEEEEEDADEVGWRAVYEGVDSLDGVALLYQPIAPVGDIEEGDREGGPFG
jgi:hypothetical protein